MPTLTATKANCLPILYFSANSGKVMKAVKKTRASKPING